MLRTVLPRPLRAAILVALGLVVAMLASVIPTQGAGAAPGARPAFQMPFQCNTSWRLNAWDHSPALDIVREPQSQTGGSPVLASAAGTVKAAGYDSGAGHYVLLNHGGHWYTVYIHLRYAPLVRAGQSVSMGTTLGYIGQSGSNASSDHLHYEQLVDRNEDGVVRWGIRGSTGEDVAVVFNGVTYTGNGGEWRNVVSRNCGGSTPPPPPATKYWVDTFANASVFASPTSTTATGTLYAGTNYVYCKAWGREIRDSSGNYNHWWLKTDPDVGPANQYVSAYYLSRWGNDEAKDNNGTVIPNCAGSTPPPATKYWVDTFANASVFASPTSTTATGTLYAGTNYVYCKAWGREIRDSSGNYNHWWLKTDPDVGPANQYVSAYYLSRWGNDEAKDNNGTVIPNC
jgi:Peptidase family M23